MKVLFVTNVNPFTASFGAEQRSYVFLKSFIQNGCDVDVAYVGETKEAKPECPLGVNIAFWNDGHHWQFSRLKNYLRIATFKMYPSSYELESIIDGLIDGNHYEYIACRYIPTAAFAGLFKYAERLLLDIDDMPEPAMAAQLKSDTWYRKVYHSDNVFINKNCKNILFIGLMSFRPNFEGMDHFITNCWNRILQTVPNASLYIAGKGLSEELKQKWMSYKNIHPLGFIDNVTEFYSQGNIVIVPVYSGAGTNIKVIEALAFGKATVITPFSTKGYDAILENGKNTYIANTDEEYIGMVLKLLNNDDLTWEIAKEGHAKAVQFYSQESINRIVEKIIKK